MLPTRKQLEEQVREQISQMNDALRPSDHRVTKIIITQSNKVTLNAILEHKFKIVWTDMDRYMLETSIQHYLDKVYG